MKMSKKERKLRDKFAAAALAGILANQESFSEPGRQFFITKTAFEYADRMVKLSKNERV